MKSAFSITKGTLLIEKVIMMKEKIKYLILLILILLLIFLIYFIKSGKIISFDDTIYSFFASNITYKKTKFFEFISNLASWQCIVLLCLSSFVFMKDIKKNIIISLNSINSVIINTIFKVIFARPRPLVLHLIEQDGFSFPSGHAMASMSFYGFLIYLILKSKLSIFTKTIYVFLLSIIILLVGISRIYLGVHYASDIIGGYLISVIYMCIYIFIVNKFKTKFKTV